jgi:hypothetical protein
MFGAEGDSTAGNLFYAVACLREHEGVRLRKVAFRLGLP